MTNEEAKAFLDNLKICIEEHPIVADWLVEIADRKTEPLICDGNCWMKKQNGEWLCEHCQREPKDEPQTDCPYREYPCDVCDEQTDCPWK